MCRASAMWLMRYIDPRFSWLLGLSSFVMAVTFYVQSFFILRELMGPLTYPDAA